MEDFMTTTSIVLKWVSSPMANLLIFFREVNIHQSPLLQIAKKIQFKRKFLYNLENSIQQGYFDEHFVTLSKINRKWLHLHSL